MNLHNDLGKAHIEHDCSFCQYRYNSGNRPCENFLPESPDSFMEYVVESLFETVEPSKDKKLKRRPVKSRIPHDDRIPPLDHYYVMLINDTLSEIRRGHYAYIFSLEQLREIMRFEPQVRVEYIPDAETYRVWLRK